MKDTGIVRDVDDLGRVVIPVELRRTLDIDNGASLEVFVTNDGDIVLRKYEPGCTFCGAMDDLVWHKGKQVCGECIGRMKKLPQ